MECPLHLQALRIPDQPFLHSADQTFSFRETDELTRRYQHFLQSERLNAGQRIATLLPNSPQWVALFFACLRQNLQICPLSLRMPERQLQEYCRILSPDLFLEDLPTLGKASAPGFRVSEEGPSTLFFTSGSSGLPKLVPHTLGNHLASAESANKHAPLEPGDRWLCSLPFYHVGGIAIIFRAVLAGATLVFSEEGEGVVESVLRYNPSHVSWVPTQLRRWLESGETHSFSRILLGGAPVPSNLLQEAIDQQLPVATSYGMTETASQISATPPGAKPEGAGKVMSHVQVRIGEHHEILLRGASVSSECLHVDGWLHTGDCGRMERGLLFVEGRIDQQFISGGENIQPERIEVALAKLEGIRQAVVVPVEDIEFGHRPAAWVDADVSSENIKRWNQELRKELPGYMLPVAYRSLPNIKGLKPNRKEFVW